MTWAMRLAALAAVALALLAGCASRENEHLNDDAFETWRIMAEQSQGHSPSGKLEVQQIEEVVIETNDEQEAAPVVVRELPRFKISLRMHGADLVAVIQALSRAAKQSIVVSPHVTGVVNVNIVETPWDQVFTGLLAANRLSYKWEGDILRVLTSEDMQFELDMDILHKKRQAEKVSIQKVEPLSTSIVKVKFAEAPLLKESLSNFLSKDDQGGTLGSIQVDEHTNSLIIQAIRPDLERLVRIVSKLDEPRAQIKLKAHIVETTRDTARALGVQWSGAMASKVASDDTTDRLYVLPGGQGSVDTDAGSLTITSDQGTGSSGQGVGIGFPISNYSEYGYGASLGFAYGSLAGNLLEMQLQMLEDENKLRIISSPSITTMDNQPAYTESGERVPYQTTENSGGTITTNVEFEDVVLRLEITPHIIDEEYLKLVVLIKKDEVDDTRTVDGNPYIIKKQTETTLIARNGETVVISGLSKHRSSSSAAGVPYLKDVPGIKRLFSTETDSNLLDEFMIFITPEVLAEWQPGERQKTIEEIAKELEEQRRQKEAEEAGEQAGPEAGQDETAPQGE
jgi:type IV pilus assembly protein PilQ